MASLHKIIYYHCTWEEQKILLFLAYSSCFWFGQNVFLKRKKLLLLFIIWSGFISAKLALLYG